MRVSVVVRSYNRATYLALALESVLGQTRPPDQVVVVDDGSTDATPALLETYRAGVEVIRLPHTGNPARVLNAGLAAVNGDAVALLDSDDVWLPDKLDRQVRVLEVDDQVGFVYGNACLMLPNGDRSEPVLRREQIVSGTLLPTLVRGMCIHPSTLLVRSACLDQVGPLDESERVNEDYFLLLRLARSTLGACVADPVALIRRHPGQVSTAHGLQAYTAAIRALEDLLRDSSLPAGVRAEARRTIGRFHAHVARALLDNSQPVDAAAARRHALAALVHHPLHRPAWRWGLAALARSRPSFPRPSRPRVGG